MPAEKSLTKNRAEELNCDVWQDFVVPPFYDRLDLQDARKPRVIIGGRGCGKTMLLKYLSHQTMFSPNRKSIPGSAVNHIGLYWKADTQFANLMYLRGLEDDVWHSAFNHMAALMLSIEILQSLNSISKSEAGIISKDDLKSISFPKVKSYDSALDTNFDGLLLSLEDRLANFQTWINNVRSMAAPTFYPGKHFLVSLIHSIRQTIPKMSEALYFVYLDEYENLRPYQQQIINTYLKHEDVPFIVEK